MKYCIGKHATMIGALAFAVVATASAYAQMGGGGMMGGFGGGGGMMGGSGWRGGYASGTMGGDGAGGGNGSGYAPGANGAGRDASRAPDAHSQARAARNPDLGPLYRLDLTMPQLDAISAIDATFRNRRSSLDRNLAAEQDKLRALAGAPEHDRAKIERQFDRVEGIRREMLESSIDAMDRMEAQLSAQQRQRLHRIAPHWTPGG